MHANNLSGLLSPPHVLLTLEALVSEPEGEILGNSDEETSSGHVQELLLCTGTVAAALAPGHAAAFQPAPRGLEQAGSDGHFQFHNESCPALRRAAGIRELG